MEYTDEAGVFASVFLHELISEIYKQPYIMLIVIFLESLIEPKRLTGEYDR